jgi:hypothetical protein
MSAPGLPRSRPHRHQDCASASWKARRSPGSGATPSVAPVRVAFIPAGHPSGNRSFLTTRNRARFKIPTGEPQRDGSVRIPYASSSASPHTFPSIARAPDLLPTRPRLSPRESLSSPALPSVSLPSAPAPVLPSRCARQSRQPPPAPARPLSNKGTLRACILARYPGRLSEPVHLPARGMDWRRFPKAPPRSDLRPSSHPARIHAGVSGVHPFLTERRIRQPETAKGTYSSNGFMLTEFLRPCFPRHDAFHKPHRSSPYFGPSARAVLIRPLPTLRRDSYASSEG